MTAILTFFAGPYGRWIVVAALVLSALFAGGVYERSVGYEEGIQVGADREIAQAKVNAAAVIALDAKYRQSEKDHAAKLAALGAKYANDLKAAKARHDADVAAALDGSLRLSFTPDGAGADGGPAAAACTAPAGRDAQARTELPRAIAADLLSLANDADEVVDQLAACQAVVESDRSMNPTPKGASP